MRFRSGDTLVIATHNAGKLREISDLLSPYGVLVRSVSEFGLSEPEETEATFAGNARIKAHYAAKGSGLPALADDSGLEVDALGGDPGVYTADWAETLDGRDFGMAMAKVNDAVRETGVAEPWSARFRCVLCLAFPDGDDLVFDGRVEGRLTWPPRGDRGFGFDPVFVPAGHDETFGEMEPSEKHRISHRADAFAKFVRDCLG